MKKRYALLFSFFITLCIAGSYYFYNNDNREIVQIIRVIDGDTVVLADGRTVRFLNINAPEKKTFSSQEATDFIEQYTGKDVELEVTGTEKYGRFLGRIYTPNYLNLNLVEYGLASIFLVNEKETQSFYTAQKKAAALGVGMWEHSEHFGCLEPKIHEKEEFVSFTVHCQSNLVGWTIKDESTKTYTIEQGIDNDFILFSEAGQDSKTELFWDKGNVWNDDRDSLFVRDQNGRLVYYESYGY